MSVIMKILSIILAIVMLFTGMPVNENWFSILQNIINSDSSVAPSLDEQTATDAVNLQLMSNEDGTSEQYRDVFSQENVRTDELYISLADMLTGKTNVEALATTNYAYLLNEFDAPYTSVYNTLLGSECFKENSEAYTSLYWLAEAMQTDESYYNLLVYSDLLISEVKNYGSSNVFYNEVLAWQVDMGKQLATTMYIDFYQLVDVVAEDIPDQIYLNLAETYGIADEVVLEIKNTATLGADVYNVLWKLAMYKTVTEYFSDISSAFVQVRSQTKEKVIQNALNYICEALAGVSAGVADYLVNEEDVTEPLVFDAAVSVFKAEVFARICAVVDAGDMEFDDMVSAYLYSNENPLSKFKTLETVCEFEELLKTAATKTKTTFISSATLANAKNVVAAHRLTIYTVDYALKTVTNLATVVVSENLQETLNFSEAGFTNYISSIVTVRALINETETYIYESTIVFWADTYWSNYYDLFIPFEDYAPVDYKTIVINNNGDLTYENNTGGDGTPYNPYRIYTMEDFDKIRNYPSQHYILMNDITVTSSNNWTPIPSLTGSLNGNGYSIIGFLITSCSGNNAGLIAVNSGRIRNLSLESASVTSSASNSGILVGTNNGVITNCYTSGEITVKSSSKVGGLVGYNTGTVETCYSQANVTGPTTNSSVCAGGLVGYSHAHKTITTITYSYATGVVKGYYAGGLVGYNYAQRYNDSTYSAAIIKYCYAKGNVFGTVAGGFVGENRANNTDSISTYAFIAYCYAIGDVGEDNKGCGFAGQNNHIIRFCYYSDKNVGNSVGFPATLTRLLEKDTYYGWDFENIWSISADRNDGYPYINLTGVTTSLNISGWGVASSPYIITNEKHIVALMDGTLSLGAHYRLGKNIDITAEHWTPISGNFMGTFTGVFDGNGFTISGVKLAKTYFSEVAFISINSGTIENLYLECSFTNIIGNVAGVTVNNSGVVDNCHADVEILNANTNNCNTGGLVAYNTGRVLNSSTSGIVESKSTGTSTTGGLVGNNYNNNATVSKCNSSAEVTAPTNASRNYTGGLVGQNHAYSNTAGNTAVTAVVEYSYATGNVSGYAAGGLVGYNYSYSNISNQTYANGIVAKISNCYALGNVNGSNAGGLVSYNDSRRGNSSDKYGYSIIEYCYVAGAVNDGAGAGLVYSGIDSDTHQAVRYSYYIANNAGNQIGFSTTRIRQQSTYYGWDFENIWTIEENVGTPTLRSNPTKKAVEIIGEGTVNNPYLIENEKQLFALVCGKLPLDGCYMLLNDITVTAQHWTPIGANGVDAFSGIFDGADHTVSGILLSNTQMSNIGFFGENTGTIKNLKIQAVFTGVNATRLGGLVSCNSGVVDNCHADVEILNANTNNCNTGGLVAYNTGMVKNSSTSGTVESKSTGTSTTGGLVGNNYNNNATVSKCNSSAEVTAPTNASRNYTGGLVGQNYAYGNTAVTAVVEYSYATGNVSGYAAGGLVGYNYSYSDTSNQTYANGIVAKISNCYALGNVNGSNAGGLVSYNDSRIGHSSYKYGYSIIEYCYAAGAVNDGAGAGLVYSGLSDETNLVVRYSYFANVNTYNTIGFGVARSRLMRQETYYGWDFENVWVIDESINSGYPYLNYNGIAKSTPISGNGSADNPYIIENENHLIALVDGELSKGANYILVADIDVSAFRWTPIGGNGTSEFSGNFDGNGYTIYGVKLNNTTYDDIGFFGENTGTIKNLKIQAVFTNVSAVRLGGLVAHNAGLVDNCHADVEILNANTNTNNCNTSGLVAYNTGMVKNSSTSGAVESKSTYTSYTGGLVGHNYNATISKCNSSADVTVPAKGSNSSHYPYAGGLVGCNQAYGNSAVTAVVEYSYATGNVSGYAAGGLVGYNCSYSDTSNQTYANGIVAKISNCYALGNVNGSNAGGLVSYNDSRIGHSSYKYGYSIIEYCYAAGLVNDGAGAGLVYNGLSHDNNCAIRYCYYNSINSGNMLGFPVSLDELKTQEFFYGWNFDDIWVVDESQNDGYPYISVGEIDNSIHFDGFGDEDSPYLITNEEQLIAIVDGRVSKGAVFRLENDIELSAAFWTPIGANGTSEFSGIFDGNGYTISGIRMVDTFYDDIGFFGKNTGVIKNLNIEALFTGVDAVRLGGLVANNSGNIENCNAKVEILNIRTGAAYTGGLIGYSGVCKVLNSSTSGAVESKSTYTSYTGGLVGHNYNATISKCNSSADVTVPAKGSNSSYYPYAGGLVGCNQAYGNSAVTAVVEYSYATGNVSGYAAGGLVGYNYSYSNAYNQTYANGIIAKIINCYALGNVNGSNAGGLVSYNDSRRDSSSYGYSTIEYCYAAGLVNDGAGAGLVYSGLSHDYNRVIRYCYYNGTNTGNKIGFDATTDELKTQELYYGWNFNNEWIIADNQNGGYPSIKLRGIVQKVEIAGYGDEEEPYIIENEQQLWALVTGKIEAAYASHYKLANDIYVTAKHWTPIGANGMGEFTGVFDGNGHTIHGIVLSNTAYENVGLFGKNSGTIKNLGVNVSFNGGTYTGAIVATNNPGGRIEKCWSTGSVTSNNYAGGLVGWNNASSSTNNVVNCYSTASVSSAEYAGGLVGYNQSASGSSGYANVTSCYSIGSVRSTKSTSYAGGLVGQASGRSVVTDSYYNSETSGCTDTRGVSCTTSQMKLRETYTGFDFNTIWAISDSVNEGYPFIRTPDYSTEKNLVSVSIVSRPDKTTYYVGDTLDTTGLVIRLNYSNGTSETVDEGFTVTYDFTVEGTKSVRVTYETKTASFSCSILPVVAEKIEIVSLPSDLNYYIGDELDISGMVVKAYFSNGTVSEITNYTLNYDFSTAGNKTVTVKFEDVSATFTATVSKVVLNSLEITSLPEKQAYYVGDELELNGFELTAKYDNGDSRTVSGYTVEYDFSVAGSAIPVKVSFGGKTIEFTVEVINVLLESIDITSAPLKTVYTVGETFDVSGMEVTAYFDNGTSQVISNYSLSYDFSVAGETKVTVSYLTKSKTIDVTVEPLPPVLEELMITQLPSKLEYYQNEVLDLSDMVVTAIYNDGSSEDVVDYTVEGYRPHILGEQTVAVKYGTLSTTFVVNVIEPVALLDEKLIVSSETARAGETVTVKINVENNPGVAAFRFYMDYDTSLLTVSAINQGEALSTGSVRHNLTIADGKLIIIWDYPENTSADGELFEIVFEVAEDAPAGEIPLTIYYDSEDVCDENLENVDFSVVGGGITIYDLIFGDLNGDGLINMKDKLLLSKYLASSIELTEAQLAAADIYKDGAVNMRDALLFNQYLTGYDVILGQQK